MPRLSLQVWELMWVVEAGEGSLDNRREGMGSEKKYSWTKEGVFEELGGRAELACSECVVEIAEGVGDSVVVSIYAEGDTPISIEMNGEEVLAEVVMFSLER